MTLRQFGSDWLRRFGAATHRLCGVALATLIAVAIGGGIAAQSRFDNSGENRDHDTDEREAYAIGLWGDLPYSAIQTTVGVPNLIVDMNRQRLAFTVHNGDLKTGNGDPKCDDNLYVNSLNYFNSLNAPAMFTPGDNDWTDCDRLKNGGFNSLERLTHIRAVMFNTPYSFGRHRIHQQVQTDPLCLGVSDPLTLQKVDAPCVENRRWSIGGVTYATLNIQGSCNNLCGDGADPAEWNARNQADIQWMRETFAYARDHHSAATMFIAQADPGFSQFEFDAPQRNPKTLAETDGNPDGFMEFLMAFRDEVVAFRKPVAYVHGDSHYFRIDKPLLNSSGARLENFTRVETFGDHAENNNNDVNWVKVLVDAESREVFAYQPQIVPGNRTAVPSPSEE